jgi:prepilin-type N-terminal cleavage/methylation domain-containing protein
MIYKRGYTLVELMVAIGLFALVMTLASGTYLVMIHINQQVQSIATGIDNLAFALETMTRDIRTGTDYDGINGSSSFTFRPAGSTQSVTYSYTTQNGPNGTVGAITKGRDILTDSSVDITSLVFYVSGTLTTDKLQPSVTIIISGKVYSSPGKWEEFTVQTGATMRGSDI